MHITCKLCDICHQSAVCWPSTFTVVGPRDLCGNCYWRYRDLLEQMEAFFNAQHSNGP